jgi:hypothetical protein
MLDMHQPCNIRVPVLLIAFSLALKSGIFGVGDSAIHFRNHFDVTFASFALIFATDGSL